MLFIILREVHVLFSYTGSLKPNTLQSSKIYSMAPKSFVWLMKF
jgi:hypothetical protein